MKKILFAFLVCASYLAPVTAFSQANKYFHDRIDTTIYATTTGTDAYTGTNTDPNFNVAGYVRGLMVSTFIVNGNTGACTYRLVTRTGALPVVAIKKQNGAALVAGDIPDSTAILLLYYGSYWRLEGLYSTASSAWSLTGNVGTVAGVNFLGTTDAVDLVFKTNNTEKARISSAGILSLGLASTNNGSLLFRNSTNANTLTINSGVTSASYALTLPTAQGAANSLLLNDGAGALSWNTGTGLFWALNGNTVGAEKWIGTADNFDLPFRTNNVENMILNTSGNLGIGTDPTARVHIKGSGTSSATSTLFGQNSASLTLFQAKDNQAFEITNPDYVFNGTTIYSRVKNNRGDMIAFYDGGAITLNDYNNQLGGSLGTQTFTSRFLEHIFTSAQHSGGGNSAFGMFKFKISNFNSSPNTFMAINGGYGSDNKTLLNVTIDNTNTASTVSPTAIAIVDATGTIGTDAGGNQIFKTGINIDVSDTYTTTTTGSCINRGIYIDSRNGNENYAIHCDNGDALFDGRVLFNQGTDVASSSTITLTYTGNSFELTGTTAVDFITTTGWREGAEITLISNENVTINDDAGGGNILLAGNANFSMTANDVLTLIYSSTTAGGTIWREKSRSVN